jgi:hypothetical protein
VRDAHAGARRVPAPIRPNIRAYQTAAGADHARAERSHYRVIGKPISIERGAVIAPRGRAIDQQLPAAVGTDVAHGNGWEGLLPAGLRPYRELYFTAEGRGNRPERESRSLRRRDGSPCHLARLEYNRAAAFLEKVGLMLCAARWCACGMVGADSAGLAGEFFCAGGGGLG